MDIEDNIPTVRMPSTDKGISTVRVEEPNIESDIEDIF
jgi:hypothetical protein